MAGAMPMSRQELSSTPSEPMQLLSTGPQHNLIRQFHIKQAVRARGGPSSRCKRGQNYSGLRPDEQALGEAPLALPVEGATQAPIALVREPSTITSIRQFHVDGQCAPAAVLPFYEGEAPLALPVEGATQAPLNSQAPLIEKGRRPVLCFVWRGVAQHG